MKITHAVGRCLVCIECRAVVDVLEAWDGATTDEAHRWIVPAEYVCGACCEATQATVTATKGELAVVA